MYQYKNAPLQVKVFDLKYKWQYRSFKSESAELAEK